MLQSTMRLAMIHFEKVYLFLVLQTNNMMTYNRHNPIITTSQVSERDSMYL